MMPKTCRTEFFLFACGGIAGFFVDYLTVLLCVQKLSVSPYAARFFSFIAAVLVTYIWNMRFTFLQRIKEGSKAPGFLPYTGGMLVGLGVNYAAYALVVHASAPMPPPLRLLLAVGIGSLSGMGFNFFLCRKVLFRKVLYAPGEAGREGGRMVH